MQMEIRDFLLRLMRGLRNCDATRFEDWALELGRPVIPHDAAMWTIGCGEVRISMRLRIGLPERNTASPNAAMIRDDLLEAHLLTIPQNQTRIASVPAPGRGGNRGPGFRHALCTHYRDPATGLDHRIGIYRRDADRTFSDTERGLKEFIAPLLVAGRNHCFTAHVSRFKLPQCASGISDRTGLMHWTEPGFVERLRAEWPDAGLHHLPAALSDFVRRGRKNVLTTAHSVFIIEPFGRLIRIQARSNSRLALLRGREREVIKLLVAGETYKGIARTLGISPSTVTKHVNSIHKKTGARNTAQLIRMTAGSGGRV